MTYLLTNVPATIERALRERAAAEHKTAEQTILDALARDLGVERHDDAADLPATATERIAASSANRPCPDTSSTTFTVNEYGAILVRPATTDAAGNPLPKRRDLSFLSEGPPLEPEVLAALEDQRRIDWDLWQ